MITPVVFVFRGVGRETSCRWNRGCYQGERHKNRYVGDFPLEEDQSPNIIRRSCLSLNLMETPVKLRRWNRRVISSNGGWEKTWKAGATPWDLLDQLRSVNISLRRVHSLKAELLFLAVERMFLDKDTAFLNILCRPGRSGIRWHSGQVFRVFGFSGLRF
ncbi:uncharacterized protein LOC111198291 [Brassica napus]|uniref:uncharacterized protein LOC111198291 n=1 Tax=Brassica napus TaxID=3708 RepID=UPI000BBEA30F|nr:uncharacterized protein LOC111198291 [Brassica napus]